MKKFRCTVTKETTMEIEIDDSMWTDKEIANWSRYFYDAESLEDIARHIARLKSECEDGEFIEGFGIPMINGTVMGKDAEGNSINICNQESYIDVDVAED